MMMGMHSVEGVVARVSEHAYRSFSPVPLMCSDDDVPCFLACMHRGDSCAA